MPLKKDDKAQAHENDVETELENVSDRCYQPMNHSESQAMSRERRWRTVSGIVCNSMNRPLAIARKRPESRFPARKQFRLDALRLVVDWYRKSACIERSVTRTAMSDRNDARAFSVAKRQAGVLTDGLALRAADPLQCYMNESNALIPRQFTSTETTSRRSSVAEIGASQASMWP